MKKLTYNRILSLITVLLYFSQINSQTTLFYEGFEGGYIPNNWTEQKVKGKPNGDMVSWSYTQNNYHIPSTSIIAPPDTTAHGNYIARFIHQSYNKEATKLVTPSINLQGKTKVVLTFSHAQVTWSFNGTSNWDILRLYYKRSIDSTWHILNSYDNPVSHWVSHSILLPDSILSATFFIGFEGITNYGYGVCIDDVKLVETGVKNMSIGKITTGKPTSSFVPTGTNDNPIIRLDIPVNGNTGNKLLKWLKVNSLNTSDVDVASNGVKVFYTQDTLFNDKNLLGKASFSSGMATVSLSNKALSSGSNSIWITYDISSTAIPKHYVEANFSANSILIRDSLNSTTKSDSLYPSSGLSSPGKQIIKQSLFFDDFETNKGWTMNSTPGDFQITAPLGLGGTSASNTWGGPDPGPLDVYSGNNILGTDLTGVAPTPGNYEKNLGTNSDYAISPSFNCKYYKNTSLRFQRWLNVFSSDNAEIDVSPDNGITWLNLWQNANSVAEGHWSEQKLSLKSIADRNENVKVRFSIGPTTELNLASGWNIDDFLVTGDKVSKDVGVSQWIAPLSNCGLSNTETITVKVKNFAPVASVTSIPLRYTIDGLTYVYDTLNLAQGIHADSSVLFSFKTKADFSQPNIYTNISAGTILSGDEDTRNDNLQKVLYSLPGFSLPFSDYFNNTKSLWMPKSKFATSTWQFGVPNKGILYTSNGIGALAWCTLTYGNYPNNDSSFVYSPCMDFSNVTKPVFELRYRSQLETNKDGVNLQASTDDGKTWHVIPKHSYPWHWNWYSCNNVLALNAAGWDTTTSADDKWVTAKQFLPDTFAGKSKVKFRFFFASDNTNRYEGFAFDDVKVYEAPANIMLDSIIIQTKNASNNYHENIISVRVKNVGIRTIYATKDTFKAGFIINSKDTDIEYLTLPNNLAVGQKAILTFKNLANINKLGANTISIFDIDPHQGFYPVADKDTISTIKTISLFMDMAVDSLYTPVSSCSLGNNVHVFLSIKNMGSDTLRSGDSLKMGFKFENKDTVWYKYKFNKKYIPGDTLNHTFDTVLNMSTVKSYSFVPVVRHKSDAYRTNDTIKRTITVWGYPTLNLGHDTTVSGLYMLHAGPHKGTYLWDDGSKDSTYVVRSNGNHWVAITSPHGCVSKDTILVNVVYYDVAASKLYSPKSSCILSNNEKIKIRINNIGTQDIPAGQHIILSYSLNQGTSWFDKDSTLSGTLHANGTGNDSIVYQFTPTVNLSANGSHIIWIKAYNVLDIDHTNDILKDTIFTYGNPPLNLGHDTTILKAQYTLYAPSGSMYKYKWNDNPLFNSLSLIITQSEKVWVNVADTVHNCISKDTVNITLLIRDGSLVHVEMPANLCKDMDTCRVEFKNTGNLSIAAGDTVFFCYILNENDPIIDTTVLSNVLVVGSSIKHTFKGLRVSLNDYTNYFTFYSVLKNDIVPTNDTISVAPFIYPLPPLNLGKKTITTIPPYLLHAPPYGDYTYNWQDPSWHDSTFAVTTSGKYYVNVIDNSDGCQKSDTAYVTIIKPDGSIVSVDNIPNSCFGKINTVKVVFKNVGISTLHKGDEIMFAYDVNNGPAFASFQTFKNDMATNDTLSYTFTNLATRANVGLNNFRFYSSISPDINLSNDTFYIKNVTINPLPSFVLAGGKDTTIINFRSKLGVNMGAGYNYLWNTGATTDSIKVETSKEYTLTVTNSSTSCLSKDSVYVSVNTTDVGIMSINAPSQKCDNNIHNVTTTLKNLGINTYNIGDVIHLAYTVNGSGYTKDTTLASNLLPNGILTVPLQDFSNKLVNGANTVHLSMSLTGDMNSDDDTLSKFITIYVPPTINVGDISGNITCYKGKVLSTGLTGNYAYLWSNGHTTDTTSVFSSGTYSVSVTDLVTTCSSSKSVTVTVLNPDGAITQLTGDSAVCNGSNAPLTVTFMNNGTLSMDAGSKVPLVISAYGNLFINDTLTLGADLASLATTTHAINNVYSALSKGTNTLTVMANLAFDSNSSNDIQTKVVNVYDSQPINLAGGQDTTLLYPPYQLNAGLGSGYSYLWSTGSIGQTLTVSSIGLYKVTATNNTNGCISNDSVYIILARYDAAVASISIASPICQSNLKQLVVVVKNNGNIILSTKDTVTVSVTVNNSDPVSKSFMFPAGTSIGSKMNCAFGSEVISNFATGNNNVFVKGFMRNDINGLNDTLSHTISVLANPTIALAGGLDTVTFSTTYNLDAGSGFSSYIWNTSATTQSIAITNGGLYKVTVTASNGCSTNDSVYMKKVLDISGLLLSELLHVYPNPADVIITVEVTMPITNPVMEAYSSDMRLVLKKQFDGIFTTFNQTIEVSDWPKGIYFIRVYSKTENKCLMQKVAIE